MEISEKTRFSFDFKLVITGICLTASLFWFLHTYISKQTERDDSQDFKIETVTTKIDELEKKVDENQQVIISKLNQIESNQSKDHDIVIRHEYMNLNKAMKQ